MKRRTTGGVIFDADGTLFDSAKTGEKRILLAAQQHGLDAGNDAQDRLRRAWGFPVIEIIRRTWPGDLTNQVYASWLERELGEESPPLLPFVRQTLERLWLAGFTLSVFTSRDSVSTRRLLERNGIAELVSFVQALEDDATIWKPHPKSVEPLLSWYEERGIPKEKLFLIGDMAISDWAVAKEVSIPFLGVTWYNEARRLQFLEADLPEECILGSIVEVFDVLAVSLL